MKALVWCERAALKTGRASRFVAKLVRRKQMEAARGRGNFMRKTHSHKHTLDAAI